MNDTIPTKEALELMLMQRKNNPSIVKIVYSLIKEHKLPYIVDGDTLVEVGFSTEAWLNKFITQDPAMNRMKEDVRKLADIREEVLISGPTGTGKELLARALHGDRPANFVAVNCAGLPETLVESLLFGHKAGTFTDAKDTRKGLIIEAHKGTFFLDEIGELPLQIQGKFLRVLQERKVTMLGSSEERDVSCRIVCATNKNLHRLCEQGKFRLDLYARVSTFELHTTALDCRSLDKKLILENYKDDTISKEDGKIFIEALLRNYPNFQIEDLDTPLNVRTLIQYIKRYKILGRLPDICTEKNTEKLYHG